MVAIGDVAGHGVGAAPEMIALRQIVRVVATDSIDPAATLSRLDRSIRELATGTAETMASVVIFMIDPLATEIRWANGGLPWPLIRHPDGTVERLFEGRVRLVGGSLGDRSAVGSRTGLAPGSVVVAFTDGMYDGSVETPPGRQEELERVLGRLGGGPLQDLVDRLVDLVRGDRLRTDDLAVVAIRIGDPDDGGAG